MLAKPSKRDFGYDYFILKGAFSWGFCLFVGQSIVKTIT